ncbi:phage minor tail protein L [Paludibacterium denitrificans]|uniref:Phage minor tail protein L n=1 Tax=Paludibacterium denitrificans TaxID=2675226 RepID=A0A844GBY0_9NEIS|nr:phage minor tail protein L [Paludibacterium denitrificans]MTD34036.1 phage minor tail protein L [Paludibacterium denitrificans]
MANPIQSDLQSLQPSALVELFVLDATMLGGSLTYFHAGTNGLTQPVVWQGNTYQPFPIQAEGFELNGKGALPQPTLTVSNVGGLISALVMQYDDLVGAKLTRKRTFARYLDGATDANPSAGFDDDVWWVHQKVSETKQAVQFKLASVLDVAGVNLPGRQVIANNCQWQYRSWNGTAFDYTNATCPYTGGAMFDTNDASVGNGSQDRCSKRLSGCAARFGTAAVLPFGGFPAAQRF